MVITNKTYSSATVGIFLSAKFYCKCASRITFFNIQNPFYKLEYECVF